MDKDIVTISREYYDQLREMERKQDKIIWHSGEYPRVKYSYLGKDESIKEIVRVSNRMEEQLRTKSSCSYPSGLKARIRFLFTGNITLRS
jgi:hypothetical protein